MMGSVPDHRAILAVLGPEWVLSSRDLGINTLAFARRSPKRTLIVSHYIFDGIEIIHASVATSTRMPTYHDLVQLHQAAFPVGSYAYQVFVGGDRHVNIHEYALHLWGRQDGAPMLPEFGREGTI